MENDWALFEINDDIPPEFGVCYAGIEPKYDPFNPTAPQLPSFALIHHPQGDLKKYAFCDNSNGQNAFYLTNTTFGDGIYVANWLQGHPEPGSSGAPLVEGKCKLWVVGMVNRALHDCLGTTHPPTSHLTSMSSIYNGIKHLIDPTGVGHTALWCTSEPSCFNNFLDSGEEDVDCGGPCPDCAPPNSTGNPPPPSACQTLIDDFHVSSRCYSE